MLHSCVFLLILLLSLTVVFRVLTCFFFLYFTFLLGSNLLHSVFKVPWQLFYESPRKSYIFASVLLIVFLSLTVFHSFVSIVPLFLLKCLFIKSYLLSHILHNFFQKISFLFVLSNLFLMLLYHHENANLKKKGVQEKNLINDNCKELWITSLWS